MNVYGFSRDNARYLNFHTITRIHSDAVGAFQRGK